MRNFARSSSPVPDGSVGRPFPAARRKPDAPEAIEAIRAARLMTGPGRAT